MDPVSLGIRLAHLLAAKQLGAEQPLDLLEHHARLEWRSSHQLALERERARPCGQLIGAGQKGAVERLRDLGIEVTPLAADTPQPMWEVDHYVVEAEAAGQRQDVHGAIADAENDLRVLRVQTQAREVVPSPGSYYVSMNQPLAPLVSAALEPDSQNSFAANRLLIIDAGQLHRVTRQPPAAARASKAAP